MTLGRLPLGYLRSTFLPVFLPALTSGEVMAKLLSRDAEVDWKMMMALLVVQKSSPIRPEM